MEPTKKEESITDKKTMYNKMMTKNESSTPKKKVPASKYEKLKDTMMTKQQKVMKKKISHQIRINSVIKSVMFYLIIIMCCVILYYFNLW
jgi:hypothetical protein